MRDIEKIVHNTDKTTLGDSPLSLNRQRYPYVTQRDFHTPVDELQQLQRTRTEDGAVPILRKLLIFTIAIVATSALLFLKQPNIEYFSQRPWVNFYSLLILFYMVLRYVLSLLAFHDQKVTKDRERKEHWRPALPTHKVSVIIVGRNEEKVIYETITRCFKVWYPQHLMEVIAVDDGSTDSTYFEMLRAKEDFPKLKIIRFKIGKGKKYGMASGVQAATGEIVVFVDSDSFVQPDAITNIVKPFSESHVAAVSGRSDVENQDVNLLTRMQSFRYFVSFQYMKAAESFCKSVTCCPGCFSAYRKEVLLGILDQWLHQRFLGKETTFGDDRSLTTIILRNNYEVLYQDDAICTTIVPEDTVTYLKQQVRWKKSWIRETLIASEFMWKRNILASISFYMSAIFPFATPFITFYNLLYLPVFHHVLPSYYFLGLMVVCILFSCFYASRRRDGLWVNGFLYSILYAVLLVWQMPYAILTVRKTNWGTR